MNSLLECIPNFSEGQDTEKIERITSSIASVPGVKVLHRDIGYSANRTVITFAGPPDAVVEAAFQGIRQASIDIDMRRHQGVHPRMGATDVCPLVPIRNLEMDRVIELSNQLGKRVGEELCIPVYMYEHSATNHERKNLANIRRGEYEGFREKIGRPEWKPDYGPVEYMSKVGQTVIGARDFLVAYNVNLNTESVEIAQNIARDIRESGRAVIKDGKKTRIPGCCKAVKALGWYIDEYGFAQVSTNLTNIDITPMHRVFEAVKEMAPKYGVKVTGSELIGMIPERCLLDAGAFYVGPEVSDSQRIFTAIRSLGLDQLKPFDPQEKVIEYCWKVGANVG